MDGWMDGWMGTFLLTNLFHENKHKGWINLVEKSYPELIPHLSSCKSPQVRVLT
jgi:hypothetical protein